MQYYLSTKLQLKIEPVLLTSVDLIKFRQKYQIIQSTRLIFLLLICTGYSLGSDSTKFPWCDPCCDAVAAIYTMQLHRRSLGRVKESTSHRSLVDTNAGDSVLKFSQPPFICILMYIYVN